jgi:FtsZ-binding cell division protein ZapB
MRRRGDNVPDGRDVETKPTSGTADELALKLSTLEAEILGLRQLLAEVRANRDELRQEIDDLRRDRDRWQKLAEQAGPGGVGRRAWFCGRASPTN